MRAISLLVCTNLTKIKAITNSSKTDWIPLGINHEEQIKWMAEAEAITIYLCLTKSLED